MASNHNRSRYQSRAALRRRVIHYRRLRMRNRIIQITGLVMFAVAGVVIGLYIVKTIMPDHSWFNGLK